MNKKKLLSFFILFFILSLTSCNSNSALCQNNKDCKIIYSNCDCQSVSISDSRTFLENKEVCKQNICYGHNITAVCVNNKCEINNSIK